MDTQTTLQAVPAVSAPTIQSSAMIVEFTAGVWTGRKKDKDASAEVAIRNNADAGTATVTKMLLGECDELDKLKKFVANVRNEHYRMTMPWSDLGQRLIPTALYFDYKQHMSAQEQVFNGLVQAFLDVYDWEVIQAKTKIGDLFNDADYLSRHALAKKFHFTVTEVPVPESGDFRVDVGNEQMNVLRTSYQQHYERQITNAMGVIFDRTRLYLERLYNSLDYNEGEPRKKLMQGTFDNVLEMIDMLKVCNLTGDTQMEAIRVKLEDQFRGVGRLPISPEALKEDSHLRTETKLVIDDVIKSLPSLDM